MSNAIFPTFPGLSWGITKTPTWDTQIQRAYSGREIRRARQARPTWQFSLSYEVLRGYQLFTEYQDLLAFYNQRRGAFDSFLLLDSSDSVATAQSMGIGDGTNRSFTVLHSIRGWTEPVGFAVPSSVMINGVATSAYTLTDGVTILFNSAPPSGATITWSGTFYYRVRFKKDEMEFEQFFKDFWSLKRCEMTGVFDA